MKKTAIFLIAFFVISGCKTVMADKPTNSTQNISTEQYKANKTYENMAAVELNAEVYINDSVSGADTPTEEAGDALNSLDTATVSVFTEDKAKFLDTITLKKIDTNLKGQIFRFKIPFSPIKTDQGNIKFKIVLTGKNGTVSFEGEGTAKLTSKSLYRVTLNLSQTSIKRDAEAKPTALVNIDEIKADEYVQNQIVVGSALKEDEVKALLEKEGIKVTALKKGFLNNYTISFSEPSVAEALIIASKLNRFEYIETNGIVKAIGF